MKWRREYLPLNGMVGRRVSRSINPNGIDTNVNGLTIPNSVVDPAESPLITPLRSSSRDDVREDKKANKRTGGEHPLEMHQNHYTHQSTDKINECNAKLISDEKRGEEILDSDDVENLDLDESTGFIPRDLDDDIAEEQNTDNPDDTQKSKVSNLETLPEPQSSSTLNLDLTKQETDDEETQSMQDKGNDSIIVEMKENGVDDILINVTAK